MFEAHRLLYHATLGSRVLQKKKKKKLRDWGSRSKVQGLGFRVQGLGFKV